MSPREDGASSRLRPGGPRPCGIREPASVSTWPRPVPVREGPGGGPSRSPGASGLDESQWSREWSSPPHAHTPLRSRSSMSADIFLIAYQMHSYCIVKSSKPFPSPIHLPGRTVTG